MSTRLNGLDNKAAGTDPFGLTNYDKLQADIDYLVVAGADIIGLDAGNTVTITAGYHNVTVSTGNIDNLADGSGASAGQTVALKFTNSQTIRSNASGTGNIRCAGGDYKAAAGEQVSFKYDGTNWQLSGFRSSRELDYVARTSDTASISATTEGTSVAVLTGNSVNYDGTKVEIEIAYPQITSSGGALQLWLVWYCDSTVLGQTRAGVLGAAGTFEGKRHAIFDTPSAGAHTYAVKAFVSANSVVFNADVGGSTKLVPMWLRVTRA